MSSLVKCVEAQYLIIAHGNKRPLALSPWHLLCWLQRWMLLSSCPSNLICSLSLHAASVIICRKINSSLLLFCHLKFSGSFTDGQYRSICWSVWLAPFLLIQSQRLSLAVRISLRSRGQGQACPSENSTNHSTTKLKFTTMMPEWNSEWGL